MSRRHDALAALLRVRKLQRDARLAEQQRAAQERMGVEEAARAQAAAAQSEQRLLEERGRVARSAGLWEAASAGVVALWNAAMSERSKLSAARTAEATARDRSVAAERALAGAERMASRRAAEERRQGARREQRRIDEAARIKRGSASCILLVVAAMLASLGLAVEDARAQGDRVANASLERLLSDIRTRMIELERREAELREREQAVEELERAVEMRIGELDEMTSAIEQRLAEWEEGNAAKSVSKLAKIYSAMPPPQAAPLVEELDIDLATQVLAKMKPKHSAALLPLLSEPRALAISRFLGHPLGVAPAPAAKEPR